MGRNKGTTGKSGRKPKPSALRLVEGNRGNRPINKKEPKPKKAKLKPPTWLSKEAKAEWNRMAPALYKLGLFTEIDGSMFEAYCHHFGEWKRYAKLARDAKGTLGITSSQGPSSQTPSYANMEQRHLKEWTTLAGRFGLSPADRANIVAEPPSDGKSDPMEAVLD